MLFKCEIPVQSEYDVVVCGGGVSGFSAAVSAARMGLKTALIEKTGCLGGVATNGGVCHLLGGSIYDDKIGKLQRNVGGIFEELTNLLVKTNAAVNPENIDMNNNPHGWLPVLASGVPFDLEHMKIEMEQMCISSNLDIFYFTNFIDTVCEDELIKDIILHNKSGLFALKTKAVIDATGDADVAYKSGCETSKGRLEDGLMAPASLEMHVENVDTAELSKYIKDNNSPRLKEIISKLKESGEWVFPYEIFIAVQLNEPDVYMINTIRQVGIDGVDGISITKGMITGRKENMEIFTLMKKHFPGFKNSRIRRIADVIGIRETRRIVGEYTLTVEDLKNGRYFADSIAVSSYGWDLPDPHKPSYQPMDKTKKASCFTHIPYKSLVPKTIKNLIVVGRSISVERDVLGPIRVMAPCFAMGQAAGIASALAIKNEVSFSYINVNTLQQEIVNQGGIIYINNGGGEQL